MPEEEIHREEGCGFSMPGLAVPSKALREEIPNSTEKERKQALAGSILRCEHIPAIPPPS
jgi:aerobic-type carbon monoxide dehydrogenase small subunit (CoxS/CutS family)